ncbi:hypothetical protein P175DRAFT_0432778 [Aspergillus ochraceoroseus IBT 24754]|uniref:Thioesterase domain-containing protein n=1 Tax=Aspergillus ochraceoroseus IBT 24754 TaxID=1392256 RepID=A0A2T5M4M3_9EURO|nr:uncharacterized protein P175DRAFT_0432778 [Aspergillus ochraceoroseus IBT 24754]PTU23479.1 hypothetical protein P175DRAFT_0432778 [Aspergillus ochraceoroseus IBT 24754]
MPSHHAPSLLEATSSVSLKNGSRNEFVTNISPDWCSQHSVLGGYLNALILTATRKFVDQEFGQGRYPDPIHVFVQFLHMVSPGPVSISCKPLRTSSRQCVVQAELTGPQSPSDGSQVSATVCIVTFADLTKESGLTQETKPSVATPIPNRETECVRIDGPVVDATPIARKLHLVAPFSPDGLWGHRLGGHRRELWLSFRDGTKISSLLHLAFFADTPLQPPATHQAGFYSQYALSTLCLSLEFKKRPDPSTEWVLIRSNSTQVSEGRYDMNMEILDEAGDLLALSNHVVYVFNLRSRTKKASKI